MWTGTEWGEKKAGKLTVGETLLVLLRAMSTCTKTFVNELLTAFWIDRKLTAT